MGTPGNAAKAHKGERHLITIQFTRLSCRLMVSQWWWLCHLAAPFDSFTSVYVPATSSDRFQVNALTSLYAGDHAPPAWRPALPTPSCCAPGSFAVRARGVYKGVEMVVISPAFPSPSSVAPVDSVFCLFVVVLGRTVNRTLVLPDSCRKFSLLSLPQFPLSGLRSVW